MVTLEEHLHAKVIGQARPIFSRGVRPVSVCGRRCCNTPCGPSAARATLDRVLIATLICSDEACAEELDLVADDLAALDAAACACGCTLVVLSISDWSPAELPLLV
jgi:hypothetical protein